MLDREEIAQTLLACVRRASETYAWSVLAFVVMPDHVHVLAFPRSDAPDASRLLFAIKRPASFKIKMLLSEKDIECLTTPQGRFRLWQAGGGHDRNLRRTDSLISMIEYIHANPARAGLCARPEEWRWSSWRQWHGDEREAHEWEPRVDRSRV